jgi:hypothetical protein
MLNLNIVGSGVSDLIVRGGKSRPRFFGKHLHSSLPHI